MLRYRYVVGRRALCSTVFWHFFCPSLSPPRRCPPIHTLPPAGLYTDPSSGSCTNASDPLSFTCAFGAGSGCTACPTGALCPGGYRLWPRAGYWVPADTTRTVVPCDPPNSMQRCMGWSVAAGATVCGPGFRQGSYRCNACASGYFPFGDGTCA
jgi:hypothetical protein